MNNSTMDFSRKACLLAKRVPTHILCVFSRVGSETIPLCAIFVDPAVDP